MSSLATLSDETIPNPLNFTDNAALKVYELMQEENNLQLSLRIYVTGGGCSGLQYNFAFAEAVEETDTIIEKSVATSAEQQQVKLVVDPISLQYLIGAEVDYKDELEGGHFVIRNPNAKGSCGCGSSFAV